MHLVILGVTGSHNFNENLVNILVNANGFLVTVFGIFLGALLTAGHFYVLRKTVMWSFDAPSWGTLLVIIPGLLRFAILAVILFIAISFGGFHMGLGVLIGVTIYLFAWVFYQNAKFNRRI